MAHFVLSDFLNLSLQQSADTSSPLLGLNMAPAESLMLKNPSRPVARASQGLPTESLSLQQPKGSKSSKDRTVNAEKVALQTQSDAGACHKTAGWCSVHDAWHEKQPFAVISISFAHCLHLEGFCFVLSRFERSFLPVYQHLQMRCACMVLYRLE